MGATPPSYSGTSLVIRVCLAEVDASLVADPAKVLGHAGEDGWHALLAAGPGAVADDAHLQIGAVRLLDLQRAAGVAVARALAAGGVDAHLCLGRVPDAASGVGHNGYGDVPQEAAAAIARVRVAAPAGHLTLDLGEGEAAVHRRARQADGTDLVAVWRSGARQLDESDVVEDLLSVIVLVRDEPLGVDDLGGTAEHSAAQIDTCAAGAIGAVTRRQDPGVRDQGTATRPALIALYETERRHPRVLLDLGSLSAHNAARRGGLTARAVSGTRDGGAAGASRTSTAAAGAVTATPGPAALVVPRF